MNKNILGIWVIVFLSFNFMNAQNAPVTGLPVITFCSGVSSVSVPVKVSAFNNVGAVSLTMHFDSLVLSYQSWSNNSGFPGLIINSPVPGTIIAAGYLPSGSLGYSLADSSVFFTLNFNFLGGSTVLSWIDDGSSCEYSGPPPIYPTLTDSPQSSYYADGSVTELYIPAPAGPLSGPQGGIVCQGQNGIQFSVSPILNATGYSWEVPSGASITSGANTNSITVDFSNNALPGLVSVYGTSTCGNGDPASMNITITYSPGNAGTITGSQVVCQGQTQVDYSVNPIPYAVSYNWTVPQGAIITGGFNTNNITVSYDNSISGDILVAGTNDCGNGSFSAPYPVTVNLPPAIIVQPISPAEITAGSGTAIFSVIASGIGLTYQWQEFVTSWTDISSGGVYSGMYTNTLQIADPPFGMNGYRYRCIVAGDCLPSAITDGTATLKVRMPVGTDNESLFSKLEYRTYPNPFSDLLSISCYMPVRGQLIVSIHNALGEEIESWIENVESTGICTFKMNTANFIPGIYTVSLKLKTEHTLINTTSKVVCNH